MNYFKVTNWEKFQHYKDRNPPWIKLHYELLSSRDWVSLSDASRVLAVACMLIASRNDGSVPDDPDYVKRVAYLNKTPDFSPLLSCGFLTDYDRTLADASTMHTNDCSESEAEEDSYIRGNGVEKPSINDQVQEILNHLNATTGRNIGHTKDIKACLKREKCSVEDCKKIIDYKWQEWVGTEWQKFVDATTPFIPKNFQKYLDQATEHSRANPAKAEKLRKMEEIAEMERQQDAI